MQKGKCFGILQLRFQVHSSSLEDRCLCGTIPCNHSEILRPARERLLAFLFEPWRGKVNAYGNFHLRPMASYGILWHPMASYGILWPSHEIHCHFYVRRATGGERCPKPPSVQGLVAVKLLTRRKTSCMDQIATGFFCSSVTELALKCPRTVPNLDPAELTKRAQPGARTLEDPCHLWVQLQDRVQGRIGPWEIPCRCMRLHHTRFLHHT